MTYSEILELVRAGYTKAEIAAMVNDAPAAPEAKAPAADETPEAPEAKPTEGENKPKSEPEKKEPTEVEKLVSALGLRLDTLTKAVQAANVGTIEGKRDNMEESTESILARIINPMIGGKD